MAAEAAAGATPNASCTRLLTALLASVLIDDRQAIGRRARTSADLRRGLLQVVADHRGAASDGPRHAVQRGPGTLGERAKGLTPREPAADWVRDLCLGTRARAPTRGAPPPRLRRARRPQWPDFDRAGSAASTSS